MTHPTTVDWDTDLTSLDWAPDDDPAYRSPRVDIDRRLTSPAPLRHVHGSWDGTDSRFSFYLPEPSAFRGRLLQQATHMPLSETLALELPADETLLSWALAHGAVFIETNCGGDQSGEAGIDSTIGAYRVHAAAARLARQVTARLYGDASPVGILFGGSGGAYRTMGASEATENVWQGFVPIVPGTPVAIPNVFSIRMHALRILRPVMDQVVDAYDAGGDPAALSLTDEQRGALIEATAMGFPPRSWFGWRTMGLHGFSVLYPAVMMLDPTYAEDFWTVPGYLGVDPTSSVHRDRVVIDTTITAIERASAATTTGAKGSVDQIHEAAADGTVVAVRLAQPASGWFLGAELTVTDGGAAGAVLRVDEVDTDLVHLEGGQEEASAALAVGDAVHLDNSRFLASQTFHRHQDPGPDYPVWDALRDTSGAPRYPQRPLQLGPIFTQGASGILPSGRMRGKVIMVSALLDREAFAWQADWWRARIETAMAECGDTEHDGYRLWYVDNALHGDTGVQEFPDRSVPYTGVLQCAMSQLYAWIEDGTEASPSTGYEVHGGQVVLSRPDVPHEGDVQPRVALSVRGAEATTAEPGSPVEVSVRAWAPGAGVVTDVVLLVDGEERENLAVEPSGDVTARTHVVLDTPGTHFLAARVTAQADGAPRSRWNRPQNIARARVVVR